MRTRTYGLDSSTIQYAQRIKSGAGVTLAPERLKEINKFVVGIKRLGLWGSMVAWPMRSIHNAGTGSTVYSLGGLGVYNGIITNQAAWDSKGLLKSLGSTGYLATTLSVTTTGGAIFFYNTTSSPTSRSIQHFGQNANTAAGFPIVMSHGGGLNLVMGQATSNPSVLHIVTATTSQLLNQFYSEAASWNPNTASLYFNGQLVLSNGAYSPGPYTMTDGGSSMNNIIILGSYGNSTPTGNTTTHSFGSIFNVEISNAQHQLIYNLYRATLAKNLGLV